MAIILSQEAVCDSAKPSWCRSHGGNLLPSSRSAFGKIARKLQGIAIDIAKLGRSNPTESLFFAAVFFAAVRPRGFETCRPSQRLDY
jgi:hypothetical protein